MITDPTSRSGRNRGDRQPTAEKYRRVYPPPNTTNSMPSTAQLRFIHSSFVGQGSHSAVYPAELTLDDRFTMLDPESPASAPTRTWGPAVVQVVVKVTDSYLEDRKMLENEAAMYTAMRKRWPVLSEHWSGFNAISEARHPTDDDVGFDVRVPATAVVPQFYGYYVPVDSTSRSRPLMLLENCGVQITPRQLSQRDKMTCHTLIHRLWFAGVAQGSVYERNFVVQRGPLTHPPHLRSRLDNSSFRIIDFGRGEWIEEVQRELDWGKMTGEQRRISKLVYASARDALYGGTRRRKYYEENY
ncbi:hypothetical protein C8F01DRAFT_92913 [Mycena amicta]|nr:hypothetical protein C8F01DRAFT_92913 [Mycena amicta]